MVSTVSFGALPPKSRYVSEQLIIGAKQKLLGLRQLRDEENVTRVIDLRNGRYFKRFKEFLTCKMLGLDYESRPMMIGDRFPLVKDEFEQVHSLISSNNTGRTFVHCNSGVHRSLLVAAFEEFKAGRIKTFSELADFLRNDGYFQLGKKVSFGIKMPLTQQDVDYRTSNLIFQRNSFWNMVNA